MKRNYKPIIPILIVTATLFGWVKSSQAATVDPGSQAATENTALSTTEIADLLWMREEEKLAHDVYIALNNQWGHRIFGNIARAEQKHMDALLNLLNQYGLADPVGANPPGVFENKEIQALYDQLVAEGGASLADALRIGVEVEESDISDLEDAIEHTTHTDIAQTYRNLQRGSENHLAAFVRVLQRQTRSR